MSEIERRAKKALKKNHWTYGDSYDAMITVLKKEMVQDEVESLEVLDKTLTSVMKRLDDTLIEIYLKESLWKAFLIITIGLLFFWLTFWRDYILVIAAACLVSFGMVALFRSRSMVFEAMFYVACLEKAKGYDLYPGLPQIRRENVDRWIGTGRRETEERVFY